MPDLHELSDEFSWLDRAKELQAIAQNGITFARDPFDLDRYRRIREIAAEMMAKGSMTPQTLIDARRRWQREKET